MTVLAKASSNLPDQPEAEESQLDNSWSHETEKKGHESCGTQNQE
jgi:hypothetical protein